MVRMRSLRNVVAFVVGGLACSTPAVPSSAAGPVVPTAAQCAAPPISGDPHTSVPPRCVVFAGLQWVAKASPAFDPGPNAWSDDGENVWVDDRGLHLRITNRGGRWYAAEVVLNESLGLGTYTFRTETRLESLDPVVVFGLFTYNYPDPAFAHRELDVEFSRSLGFIPGANAHFTVQPFRSPGHTHDFTIAAGSTPTMTHSIDWRSERVVFQSGTEQWSFVEAAVPAPGGENVRINLWPFGGRAPTGGGLEIVVSAFEFRR